MLMRMFCSLILHSFGTILLIKFKWDMMKRVSVIHLTETCFRYLRMTKCKLYPPDPYYI